MIGGASAFSLSSNTYMGMFLGSYDVTEANVEQVMAVAGTVSELYARVNTAPGSGKSWTMTVRRNGANTSVTCTISGTATSCADGTNSAAFTEGDRIAIKITNAGGPSGSPGRWTAKLSQS